MSDYQNNAKLLAGIESCRPGSDDCDLPEMADLAQLLSYDAHARDLFERVQQSDAAIGAAFRAGPVPEGLQDRLLAALDSAEDSPGVAAPDHTGPGLAPPFEKIHAPTHSRRKWAWFLAAAATLLVAAGVTALLVLADHQPLTVAQVLHGASAAEEALDDSESAWNSLSANAAIYPSSARLKVKPSHWQVVPCLSDRKAVAYRFARHQGATLLVFQAKAGVADLPAAPPTPPQAVNSRAVKATWAEDGLVYVLVLRGDNPRHQYHALVDAVEIAAVIRPQSLPSRHHG